MVHAWLQTDSIWKRGFARTAVAVAIEEQITLMAVLTGGEFGVEAVMFMEVPCETMVCPLDVVLQELA